MQIDIGQLLRCAMTLKDCFFMFIFCVVVRFCVCLFLPGGGGAGTLRQRGPGNKICLNP